MSGSAFDEPHLVFPRGCVRALLKYHELRDMDATMNSSGALRRAGIRLPDSDETGRSIPESNLTHS